jgi:NADPH-dependent 2,4-dienoyl-CoA reductase/sulfur reductase-like enzyme
VADHHRVERFDGSPPRDGTRAYPAASWKRSRAQRGTDVESGSIAQQDRTVHRRSELADLSRPRVIPAVVIGGGFSGALTAAHVARRGVAVTLVARERRLGPGLAYGGDNQRFLRLE